MKPSTLELILALRRMLSYFDACVAPSEVQTRGSEARKAIARDYRHTRRSLGSAAHRDIIERHFQCDFELVDAGVA